MSRKRIEADLGKLTAPMLVVAVAQDAMVARSAIFGDRASARVQAKAWFMELGDGVVIYVCRPVEKVTFGEPVAEVVKGMTEDEEDAVVDELVSFAHAPHPGGITEEERRPWCEKAIDLLCGFGKGESE